MTRFLLTTVRIPTLVLLALACALLGYFAYGVPVEQSNESMNSPSQEQLDVSEEFRRLFGSDEDLILTLTHPGLFSPEVMSRLRELTSRIEQVDGVRRVFSLSNAIELVPGRFGIDERPLVGAPSASPDFAGEVERAVARNPELTGFLVSRDARTAAVLIEIELRPDDDDYRPQILRDVRALMSQFDSERDSEGGGEGELHLTGIDAQKYEVTRLLERDQSVLVPASVVVLAVILGLFFRRVSAVLIPLAVTGVTLVWTLGLYGLSGFALNTMTSLLPPVLMVLSVTTSVHLYVRWLAVAAECEDPFEAVEVIVAVVRDLRFPCFFTSFTTALGMLSLVVSDTPAVRLFGAFTALGVVLSLGLSFVIVPIGLSFLARPQRVEGRGAGVAALLAMADRASTRRPLAVLAVAAVVTLLGLSGIPRIENNTDLVRFLKSSSELYRDSMFIDRNMAGISTLEFVISRGDGTQLNSLDAVDRLVRFRKALLAHPEVGGGQSVLDLLSAIVRAESGGQGWQAPGSEAQVLESFDLLEAAGDADLVRRVIAPDFRHARVRTQLHALGTAAAAPLEDAILFEAHEIFGSDYRVDVTGAFHHVVRDSNGLVANQVKSFSFALGLILVTIGCMFRSLRLLLVAAIPNLIPIVWTGGLMGYLGIDLSTGTAMIASVVIGLAVDDTIHYLTRFQREQSRGTVGAIHATTTGIGTALLISSVVLVIGFWVGALGSFKPTIYFSLLTGVTMAGALICDLLILPATLVLLDRRGTRG